MKFIKSKFAQKLIIILIALMIFNIALPHQVNAWDLGGILLKPISAIILANMVTIDVTIGVLLNGLSIGVHVVGGIIDLFTKDNVGALENIHTGLEQLFIGPDTIFAGKVRILDANIFEVESFTNPTDFLEMFKSVGTVDGLANVTAPGYNMIVSIKEAIATTYKVLRNICGYIMLAGLIFTGIRILVSANIPTKRTQYLMYLQDWLIGMVLLIFSHVIMVGIFYISDTLVEELSMSLNGIGGINTSLILNCLLSLDSSEQIICLLMLGYLIYLTVVFVIAYFKRFMWICVLIVISPIVSIMYAFGNGTKQIYSKWLREYMMTVLVQPFHIVIYSILVSIPLNVVNSTGGFSLSGNNILELIYALVAMSFIRPAEKYVRDLFGMNQGLANMASYDSGKKTIDAAIKTITTVGTMAVTAGLGPAAMGALKGGQLLKGATEVGKAVLPDNKLGKAYGKVMDGAEKGLGKIFRVNKNNEGLNAGVNDTRPEENQGEQPPQEPSIESTEEKPLGTENKQQKPLTGFEDPNLVLERANLRGQLERHERGKDDLTSREKDLLGMSDETKEATDNLSEAGEQLTEAAEHLTEASETAEENNNDKINIESAGEEESKKTQKSKWPHDRLISGASSAVSFMQVATGNKGAFDALSSVNPDSKLGKITGKFMSSDLGNALKKFEALGGMKELHKGFNEVRDTFSPTPLEGWQATNERMGENIKARQEQQKFQFVNNEENKNYFQVKYEKELRDQYPDRKKYSDAYIKNLAKEKTESKLKSLADTYVPLGIKDAKIAYECNEDRKMYGLTAEEAVQQRTEFERFNVNANNVQTINIAYPPQGDEPRASSVSEKIPNSRELYNNGYTDSVHQIAVNELVDKLGISLERAMVFDKALMRKGGKLNEDTGDKKLDAAIKEINENYRKVILAKKGKGE